MGHRPRRGVNVDDNHTDDHDHDDDQEDHDVHDHDPDLAPIVITTSFDTIEVRFRAPRLRGPILHDRLDHHTTTGIGSRIVLLVSGLSVRCRRGRMVSRTPP